MPNENDDAERIDDLAKKIDELHDEINSSKDIFQQTVKDIKKNMVIMVVILIVLAITLVILVFVPILFSHTSGYALSSNYEIDNMKGNKITTWVSWRVEQNDQFHIHIQDSPEVTKERIQVISDAALSSKTMLVGNETYYAGWLGALQDTPHQNMKNVIPFHFHIMNTTAESGNVVIKLTNLENPDGYTAYTKTIADTSHHQILKSVITIYDIDELSDAQLAFLVRHELGHAFGLTHADNPNDLMYPIIGQNLAYISKCDVRAIINLYNDTGLNQIVC